MLVRRLDVKAAVTTAFTRVWFRRHVARKNEAIGSFLIVTQGAFSWPSASRGGGLLRIRRDAVFVSSVLFTIAFLLLVPTVWRDAQSGVPFWHFGRAAREDRALLDSMSPGVADSVLLLGQSGLAGLAVILVALIVLWNGYVRKLKWTWFVMLIIAWGWYFPLFIYQNLSYAKGFDMLRWLSSSFWAWVFFVMMTALILPIRSFFYKQPQATRSDG